ncbi:MAG: hypothetical protein U1E73_05930 [Planctomycetota bacterium]
MKVLLSGLLLAAPLLAFPQQPMATVVASGFGFSRLCYDVARHRLVCRTSDRGIWEHDGVAWGRSRVTSPGYDDLVVYDPARKRVVFVGTEVREYDGHSVVELGSAPPLIDLAADPVHSLLIGTLQSQQSGLGITAFDGVSWQTVATLPGSHNALGIANDPGQGTTWILARPFPSAASELWSWDGSVLGGPYQDNVDRTRIAFDPATNTIVGFGAGVMWSWNGSQWSQLAAMPSSVALEQFVPDTEHGVLFGCEAYSQDELWRWDGTSWSLALFAPQPTINPLTATYDSVRRRLVMCGNQVNGNRQLHAEWDGHDWQRLAVPAFGPPSFAGHAQEFDGIHGETVVFGGFDTAGAGLGATYAFDGAAWRLVTPNGPSPRGNSGITYDTLRNRVVLVGGNPSAIAPQPWLTDHWEWDGAAWTVVQPTTPVVYPALLGFDRLRGRVVARDEIGQTFEWNGSAWSLAAIDTMYGLADRRLVWNPSLGRVQTTLQTSAGWQVCVWAGLSWLATNQAVGEYSFDSSTGAAIVLGYQRTSIVSNSPAVTSDFGAGCGGTSTSTSLEPFRAPRVGEAAFHLDLRADAAVQPALIGFGFSIATVPIGNGCTLLLQNLIASRLSVTDQGGFVHMPMPLPGALAFRGTQFWAQGAVLDPASPGGLALTQALGVMLGD